LSLGIGFGAAIVFFFLAVLVNLRQTNASASPAHRKTANTSASNFALDKLASIAEARAPRRIQFEGYKPIQPFQIGSAAAINILSFTSLARILAIIMTLIVLDAFFICWAKSTKPEQAPQKLCADWPSLEGSTTFRPVGKIGKFPQYISNFKNAAVSMSTLALAAIVFRKYWF